MQTLEGNDPEMARAGLDLAATQLMWAAKLQAFDALLISGTRAQIARAYDEASEAADRLLDAKAYHARLSFIRMGLDPEDRP